MRQLLCTSVINLLDQPKPHPITQPQQPPIHHTTSIGIPVRPAPLVAPNNDGWKSAIPTQTMGSIQGWPTTSLNPPPEENISNHLHSVASHVVHSPWVAPQSSTPASQHPPFVTHVPKQPIAFSNLVG